MPQSLFDDVLYAVDPALDEWFASNYTYHRGAASIALVASVTAHAIEVSDEKGLTDSAHSHNFTLRAEDLVLSGTRFLPTAGDLIREDNGDGTNTVYQVVKRADNRCFDEIDAAGLKLQVFTNLIARTEAA